SHVFGLLMQRYRAAGLDGIRGLGPITFSGCNPCTSSGLTNPGHQPFAITSVHLASYSVGCCLADYAGIGTSADLSTALYVSPLTMIAQAMRAVLLASAVATTLAGRRSSNCFSHCEPDFPPRRLHRSTVCAPMMSNRLRCGFPFLLMLPSTCLPPLEYS